MSSSRSEKNRSFGTELDELRQRCTLLMRELEEKRDSVKETRSDLDAIVMQTMIQNDILQELQEMLDRWLEEMPATLTQVLGECCQLLSDVDGVSACAFASRQSDRELLVERSWNESVIPCGILRISHGILVPGRREVIPLALFEGQQNNDQHVVIVNWVECQVHQPTSLLVARKSLDFVDHLFALVASHASIVIKEQRRRETARRAAQFTTSSLVGAQFRLDDLKTLLQGADGGASIWADEQVQDAWNNVDRLIREGIWGAERAMSLGARQHGLLPVDMSLVPDVVENVRSSLNERLNKVVLCKPILQGAKGQQEFWVRGTAVQIETALTDIALGMWTVSSRKPLDVTIHVEENTAVVKLNSRRKASELSYNIASLRRSLCDPNKFRFAAPSEIWSGGTAFSFDVPFEIIEAVGGSATPTVDAENRLGVEIRLVLATME